LIWIFWADAAAASIEAARARTANLEILDMFTSLER
jgi:hypothetical protein